MSRKDYIRVAAAIKAARKLYNHLPGTNPSSAAIVGELCQVFRADNPNFDARRFCDACEAD